jgi:hypothetical protein
MAKHMALGRFAHLSTPETCLKIWGRAMLTEELNMPGLNIPQDPETFVNLLSKKKRFIDLSAFTEVHVSIAGPVEAGTIIDALYDNWIPVKLYHKPSPPPPAVYEYWMPRFWECR